MQIKYIKLKHVIAASVIAAASAGYALMPSVPQKPSPFYVRVGPTAAYQNPDLTPGETNPNVTQENISQTICNKNWSTKSVRDTQSTLAQKNTTYKLYGVPHPLNNVGQNQTCELDHLISLELGGGDGLSNIWPECGPPNVPLNQRYFKMKDKVENYLHDEVCKGDMTLQEAQNSIRNDWYAVYQKIK